MSVGCVSLKVELFFFVCLMFCVPAAAQTATTRQAGRRTNKWERLCFWSECSPTLTRVSTVVRLGILWDSEEQGKTCYTGCYSQSDCCLSGLPCSHCRCVASQLRPFAWQILKPLANMSHIHIQVYKYKARVSRTTVLPLVLKRTDSCKLYKVTLRTKVEKGRKVFNLIFLNETEFLFLFYLCPESLS